MRMPNTQCCICKKPLYRRPSELSKVRYVACMEHRDEAQRQAGQTEKQKQSLILGREKGTNHLGGIPKSETMKKKVSEKNKLYWKKRPEELAQRGLKMRGENHYNWKGGVSSLQISIRTSAYNLRWIKKIHKRDNYECQICKSIKKTEVHHKIGIAKLIKNYKIKTLDDARNCEAFWDINNDIVVCKKCHYKIHGKKYYED